MGGGRHIEPERELGGGGVADEQGRGELLNAFGIRQKMSLTVQETAGVESWAAGALAESSETPARPRSCPTEAMTARSSSVNGWSCEASSTVRRRSSTAKSSTAACSWSLAAVVRHSGQLTCVNLDRPACTGVHPLREHAEEVTHVHLQ